MAIRFPAYRRFEASRTETNDAMVALIVGSRISERLLADLGDQEALLSEVFTDVQDIRRFDLRVSAAPEALGGSERHFAYLAIPFVLSVYGTFAMDAIEMLKGSEIARDKVPLSDLHSTIDALVSPRHVPLDLVQMFNLARLVRNRIAHYGGIQGSNLRTEYRSTLAAAARSEWEALAGRALPLKHSGDPLDVGMGELVAVLACTKRLARSLNALLRQTLERQRWLEIVCNDFIETSARALDRNTNMRRLQGLARFSYQELDLSPQELEAALSVAIEKKRGSAD